MIGDLLKSIFGDKTAKDRKEYWPFVEKAKTAWESVQHLSDDQLREKTRGFQEQIRQSIAPLEATLEALHANAADIQTSFEEIYIIISELCLCDDNNFNQVHNSWFFNYRLKLLFKAIKTGLQL